MIKLTAGVITNKRLPANTNFDRHPDECPFCHKGVQPFLFGGFLHNNLCKLWLFYACPRADCERHFIGEYSQAIASDGVIYHFEKTLLGNYGKMDFSEDINKLSPDFSRIYNQARQVRISRTD
ncbi:hypothetical protein ACQ86N_42295 [Puia sp. P3]|uniref:hypothetical protein n=1 Tax=Puia sp. P3 TaxID=3423952 RepID=UPI003D67709A